MTSVAQRKPDHAWYRGWSFGPGIVYLLGSIGPNDLIANSAAGAAYGYSLLWALIIGYALCYFIGEASSRYVLTTGESIMEGYGRLGRSMVVSLAVAIFIRRHLNNLALTLILGTSVHILLPLPTPWSSVIWSLISWALAFWLMYRGGYRGVEWLCRPFLVILGASLVIVAVLARPSAEDILYGLFIPSYPGATGAYSYFLLLMAVAGTSVGSINHLKYPAYIYERGWRSPKGFAEQRADLALSVAGQFVFAVLIQVAAAATFHGGSFDVASIEDLVQIFAGPLGEFGRVILGIGLWAAVFTSYLGSNTGYGLIVADTYERFVQRRAKVDDQAVRDARRGRIYQVVLTLFCVPPLYVLATSWKPVWVLIATSAMFLVLTPVMMTGLLVITENRALMGDRVNGWASRAALVASILVTLYLTYESALELAARL